MCVALFLVSLHLLCFQFFLSFSSVCVLLSFGQHGFFIWWINTENRSQRLTMDTLLGLNTHICIRIKRMATTIHCVNKWNDKHNRQSMIENNETKNAPNNKVNKWTDTKKNISNRDRWSKIARENNKSQRKRKKMKRNKCLCVCNSDSKKHHQQQQQQQYNNNDATRLKQHNDWEYLTQQ